MHFHPASKGADSLSASLPTVSVIVCTRNRAAKLQQLLRALLYLDLPSGANVEFIVVDNGSTDETRRICALSDSAFCGRLRCVHAARPGTGYARNVGLSHATGTILAFVDDDVIPRFDWLQTICRQFAADPDLALLSGQVQLRNPLDLPVAIRTGTTRRRFNSVGDAFSLLIGCHFAVRREFAEKAGGFDSNFGPGTAFPAEDADFFYRVWRAEGKLVYEPSLFAWHDHGRRSPEEKYQTMRNYIVGRGAFYSKHVLARDMFVLRAFYWELVNLCSALFRGTGRYAWSSLGWLLRGFGHHTFSSLWRASTAAH